MIVDHRVRAFRAPLETEGLPAEKNHRANLVGFLVAEVGNVNEIVHIWDHEDCFDRTERRAVHGCRRSGAADIIADEPRIDEPRA